MLVIVILGFTCIVLIKLPNMGLDKIWECNKQIYCQLRTN